MTRALISYDVASVGGATGRGTRSRPAGRSRLERLDAATRPVVAALIDSARTASLPPSRSYSGRSRVQPKAPLET